MHKAHRGLLLALVLLGAALACCASAQATTTLVEHNAEPFSVSPELGGAPEFGRCIKDVGGAYENLACTKAVGSGGSYEWYPAFGSSRPLEKVGFTNALKEATVVTLETVGKTKVVCEGQSSTGRYTGNKTVGHVIVTFSKCASFGVPCASAGAPEGTIVTNTLEGELGIEETGTEPSQNKIGEELRPVTGGTGHFAAFSCGGTAGLVTGSAISPVASNAMKLTETVKFKATKGVQKPESFAGGPAATLTSSFEGPSEQAGLTLQTINTNEEKLEINSVA
jgi:hypothetical protein